MRDESEGERARVRAREKGGVRKSERTTSERVSEEESFHKGTHQQPRACPAVLGVTHRQSACRSEAHPTAMTAASTARIDGQRSRPAP
jgi:hypothetical protein